MKEIVFDFRFRNNYYITAMSIKKLLIHIDAILKYFFIYSKLFFSFLS
jgi:hypothetical protein